MYAALQASKLCRSRRLAGGGDMFRRASSCFPGARTPGRALPRHGRPCKDGPVASGPRRLGRGRAAAGGGGGSASGGGRRHGAGRADRPGAPGQPALAPVGVDIRANDPTDDTPGRTTPSESAGGARRRRDLRGLQQLRARRLLRALALAGPRIDLAGPRGRSGPTAIRWSSRTTPRGASTTPSSAARRPASSGHRRLPDVQRPRQRRRDDRGHDAGRQAVARGRQRRRARDGDLYICWTAVLQQRERAALLALHGWRRDVRQRAGPRRRTAPRRSGARSPSANGEVNVSWADRARRRPWGTSGSAAHRRRRHSRRRGVRRYRQPPPGTDRVVACGTNNNRTTLTGDVRQLTSRGWRSTRRRGRRGATSTSSGSATRPERPTTRTPSSAAPPMAERPGARVQLGAGGGATDQFEPFVSVAGNGTLSIAWYDRRNDPANDTLIDVYKTFSTDGGAT